MVTIAVTQPEQAAPVDERHVLPGAIRTRTKTNSERCAVRELLGDPLIPRRSRSEPCQSCATFIDDAHVSVAPSCRDDLPSMRPNGHERLLLRTASHENNGA
jgi:hypothetical protein